MATAKKASLNESISSAVKGTFDLDKFISSKNLSSTSIKMKEQKWIPLSQAFQDCLSIPGIPIGHITLLRGHSDTGKAQPLYSGILTPDGWTTMGEVAVGSYVIGSNGQPKEVLGVYPQGVRPVYEVTFTDGTKVHTCDEHLWDVQTIRDRQSNSRRKTRLTNQNRMEEYYDQHRIITTAEMVGQEVIATSPGKHPDILSHNYRVPAITQPVVFNEGMKLEVDPYVLGALIGDGGLSGDSVCFTTTDPFILSKVESRLCEPLVVVRQGLTIDYRLKTTDLSRGNYIRRYLRSKQLDSTSQHKFIPAEYLVADVQSRIELLQGLMDTDGTSDKHGQSSYYATTSKRLAEDVGNLVRSLGCTCTINYYSSKHLGHYRVIIADNGSLSLFSLPRKLAIFKRKSKYPAAKYVSSVIYVGEAEQQCIYIDSEDHLYVTDGYTLTHNTTALLEAAVTAQKMGVLPVFIVTEMKWNWEHAKQMGLQVEDIPDADGEVADYKGFFIYVDRERLNTIEDVAAFIADLLDEQKNGRLPYDLLFLWDSVGSIPCRLSVESNKNNNEWNAGAMSQQFGNFINQKVVLSRKQSQPYTNTMLAVNKIWVAKAESIMAQPKMKNKGGDTMYFDSSLIVTFGNVTNAGTNKIKATKNGKDVEFAKRTKISCDKNHVNDVTSAGKVIMTAHGFIDDTKQAIDGYKKQHSKDWLKTLGASDFDVVIETDEETRDIFDASESE